MMQASQAGKNIQPPRVPSRFLATQFVSSMGLLLLLGIAISTYFYFPSIFPFALTLLVGLIVWLLLRWFVAEWLAIFRYLRSMQKDNENYMLLYTTLAALEDVYETPVSYREPSIAQNQWEDITRLLQRDVHLLILGLPGAGKTMVLRVCIGKVLQRPRVSGYHKIPIYIPMKEYNAYLLNKRSISLDGSVQEDPVETLLEYLLSASELTGMRYLRPYLRRLIQRGRILLLCDGLNELNTGLLEFVCTGLQHLMDTTQNRLVMTCRELDYREQTLLHRLIGARYAQEALIAPLPLNKIDEFVQRYLRLPPTDGQVWNYSVSEISDLIKQTSLRYDCANPFMLVALMKTINDIKPEERKSINTRGLLLRTYVSQVMDNGLKQVEWRSFKRDDIVVFLSKVAFTMRRAKYRNAILLGNASSIPVGRISRTISMEELANRLLKWLEEPDPDAEQPLMTEQDLGLETLHRPYNRTDIVLFLECSRNAHIITISSNGVISFQHELIAEYFAAEYLYRMHEKNPTAIPFGRELFAEVGTWGEPVAIWAGLVENPIKLAERLAAWEKQQVSPLYNVLVLSLVCSGVAWKLAPSGPSVIRIPQNVLDLLQMYLPNLETRKKLASIFKRCADEGGAEIYRALLPLLSTIEGMADLLLLLDQQPICELLFDYLVEVANKGAYSSQIEPLKSVLGQFGESAISRTEQLSRFTPENNLYVRAAAIDILGRIGLRRCVESLVLYLGDHQEEIMHTAVNALIHLGPELAVEQVIAQLTSSRQQSHLHQIRWGALNVLQGFLAKHALSPIFYQPIIEAIVTVLSSSYTLQAQQKAKEILLSQFDPAMGTNKKQWEIVIEPLIGSLRLDDSVRAENAIETLGQIGSLITPYLQDALKALPLEMIRKRIVAVQGLIHDVRMLPDLVAMLADPSPLVREELAKTLQKFAPESIAPLIDVVLSTNATNAIVEDAAQVLKTIGQDHNQNVRDVCVQALSKALPRVVPRGTHLLVLVLQALQDERAVPPLTDLLRQVAPTHTSLACNVIQALGEFQDARAISPLIDILIRSASPLSEETMKVLSSFGEVALDELIARLDVEKDLVVSKKIRDTLLMMQPFQHQRLLDTFKQCTDTQAEQLMIVFQVKATEIAPLLVDRLFDPDPRIQHYVRQMVGEIHYNITIPPLVEALNRPEKWQPVIATYLLRYPESIPQLVKRLGEDERGEAAYAILLRFTDQILPHLVLGLDNDKTLPRTRKLVVILVRQNLTILPRVVGLFDPTASHVPTLSDRVQKELRSILIQEFPDVCLPALLQGLEDHGLISNVSEILAALALTANQRDTVLQAVFEALHKEQRRHGAEITLIRIGTPALDGLKDLIVHPEPSVAKSAQYILREMGPVAFPLIVATYRNTSDPTRRMVALQIFMAMPTNAITESLINSLRSEGPLEVEFALSLIYLRISNEAQHAFEKQEMIPALLQEAQKTNSYLPILASLLLLNERMITRSSIADHLVQFLLNYPEQCKNVMYMFLLLGDQAVEPLARMLDKTIASSPLHQEAASILGMISRHEKVVGYVQDLANYVIEILRTIQFNDPRQALYLRAFGGLLASGNYGVKELAELRRKSSSPFEQEFFQVLLGHRNTPEIEKLKESLEDIRKDLVEAQRRSQENQHEIGRLTSNLTRVNEEKSALESQLQAVQASLTQARYDNAALQAQNSTLLQYKGQNPF